MALVAAEPFYGHVIGGMIRQFTTEVPTAGVTVRLGRPVLMINAAGFTRLRRADERTAVLKHEVLHVVLQHVTRAHRSDWHPRIADVAAELVVNQHIGKWTLPEGAVTLESFPDLKLPRDLTLEQYYERLRRHGDSSLASSHSDHARWGAAEESEARLVALEIGRLVAHARDRAPRAYAALHPTILRAAEVLLEARAPKLDWRRVLRTFAESSRKTRLQSTQRRPSKRYGTLPGTRVRRHHDVVVVIDTSGSVSPALLSDFFAEVHGLWRQGATVTVVEADDTIRNVWVYRGVRPEVAYGRGGTRFDPAFAWVSARREPTDAVIYLTDGLAPAPQVEIHTPVLWLVSGHATAHLKPGRAVRIDPEAGAPR